MYKFGNEKPRMLESFGISGLLSEGAQVFYEDLFSIQHLGRVSDLLAARLKDAGADELKLRSLLLLSTFESYRAQISRVNWVLSSAEKMKEPIVVECGIDQEKIAIGTLFILPEDAPAQLMSDIPGLKDRIQKKQPANPFEELLRLLSEQADRIVFKVFPLKRKIEVVSLVGIPGKMPEGDFAAAEKMEVIVFDKEPAPAPKAKKYTELGDLDYRALLREDGKLKGGKAQGQESTTVAGHDEADDSSQTVSGDIVETDKTKIIVAGSKETEDDSKQTISGGESKNSATEVNALKEKIKVLQGKITLLESKLAKQPMTVKAAAITATQDEAVQVIKGKKEEEDGEEVEYEEVIVEEGEVEKKGFLGKIWPFKKEEEEWEEVVEEVPVEEAEAESESVAEAETETVAAEGDAVEETEEATDEVAPVEVAPTEEDDHATLQEIAPPDVNLVDSNEEVMRIQNSIDGGTLDQKIHEIKVHVSQNVKDEKTKNYIDQALNDLMIEKSRVAELVKTVNHSLKRKEFEFKSKLLVYQDETRKRDDLIKQKMSALAHVKEQLNQANLMIQRVREGSKNSATEAHLKSKYTQLQSQMERVKAESAELKRKLDETKSKMAMIKMKAAPVDAGLHQELSTLKSENSKMSRMLEEQKGTNVSVQTRMAEQERRTLQMIDEMKVRVEKAGKIATEKARESDTLKKRVTELENTERSVRSQLETAKRKLNESSGTPGSGESAA